MNKVAKIEQPRPTLIGTMASAYNMEPKAFADTVRAICLPNTASNEEFAAFLMVAKEYGLNPITREIYAFPKKGGGIQPIVGVDGWFNLINSHPQCNGIDFIDEFDEKKNLESVKCSIYRKDRKRPTVVTEYMDECKRTTEPWQKWPKRMLRHKAASQCACYAFGFAGIIDPDEAERSPEVITHATVVAPPPVENQQIKQIAHEQEAAVEAETAELIDTAAYFTDLETQLSTANDIETVEEVWMELDPEGTFDGDDINLEIAHKIKARRLGQINSSKGVD
ncbi:recombinase RecT [Ochrobactrum sp. Marseille-Q0166]|nr:recombinase RecT [Ochrobactrum sp. Marseille-Q0166]